MTVLFSIVTGISIALMIFAIYLVIQAMLTVAFLRSYLEALRDERCDPDSTPRVGDS
jgi:hypothetical protein